MTDQHFEPNTIERLYSPLRDHFDVDVAVRQGRKHLSSDTDHVSHLPTDKGQDGHVLGDGDLVGKRIQDQRAVERGLMQ